MSWDTRPLGDFAASDDGAIAIGPFGSSLKADLYVSEGIPIVRGTNLDGRPGFRGEFVFVAENTADKFSRCQIAPWDLVFPHRGAIGSVGLAVDQPPGKWLLSTSMMKFRADRDRLDPVFAFHFFRSERGRHELLKNTSQVGTPGIAQPLASLRACEIPIPPIHEQRTIASVLGAIDDKIEHNCRTIRALERLARMIFRAWFVDFDPVKAKAIGATSFISMPPAIFDTLPARLADSEIGPVPEGWQVGTLGSLLTESTRRNADDHSDLVLSAIASGELVASDDHFTKRVYSKSIRSYKVVRPGGIAFNPSRINIGSVGVNHRDSDGVVSPVYIVCNAPREFEWFLEFFLRLPKVRKQFETLASGSVRQSLRAVDFLSIGLALPSRELITAFNTEFLRIKSLSDELRLESLRLAELRDYLQPRLLDGRVRVEIGSA